MEAGLNLLEENSPNNKNVQIKAYKRRWLLLFIYISYSVVNAFEWIEYSIITNIVSRYYNVTPLAVDWTSLIYMALYIPFVIPVLYVTEKNGLRVAVLIGCLGTMLGTAIKVFSINQNHFWVVLIGQACLAISQVPIVSVLSRVAAVWFKEKEVSTACSIAVFGYQCGCAFGYALPPILVKNHSNIEEIGADFKILRWGLTAVMVPPTLAVIFYFPDQPQKPPSITQAEERRNKRKVTMMAFLASVKSLFLTGPFVIHFIAFGINFGVLCVMGIFLNQFVLQYFANAEEDAGRMGLVMTIIGLIAAIFLGIFLDKTHKFKEAAFFTYLLSSVSIVGFMFALKMRLKVLVYIVLCMYGICSNAYLPAAFEFAVELTFPVPESTTIGLIMLGAQSFTIIFTMVIDKLNTNIGPFWALGTLAALLAVGTVITGFVPNNLKRQQAFKQSRNISINFEV